MKSKCFMYAGTYTNSGSKGIYIYEMDMGSGRIDLIGAESSVQNPSYLAISSNKKYLYSIGSTGDGIYGSSGAVAAFCIDSLTGCLKHINTKSWGKTAACHLSMDRNGRFIFIANYKEGTVSVFPAASDGRVLDPSDSIMHKGSGPDKDRQNEAHAHFVILTPDEKYLCAVDLGTDEIIVYDFHRESGRITQNLDLTVKVSPGSGPRHMAFHPSGTYAYLLNELTSDIVVYTFSSEGFTRIQNVSALPDDFSGISYCAAIHISSEGDYLYASNRGHDSIAVFSIDRRGILALCSHVHTNGSYPRDFSLDPAGRFLYAANQNSDNIVLYEIDKMSGIPLPSGYKVNIPRPVCIKFCYLEQ